MKRYKDSTVALVAVSATYDESPSVAYMPVVQRKGNIWVGDAYHYPAQAIEEAHDHVDAALGE